MRAIHECQLAISLLALVALCASCLPATELAAEGRDELHIRANFSPAKLFDFDNFKHLFKKTYSGFLEELVRRKYFLSRAFRAFISAIKYKYRKSTFFLAVNHMSDWTPEEDAATENKMLAEQSVRRIAKSGSEEVTARESELPELLPADAGEVERALKRLAQSGALLMERNTADERNVTMEKLIHTGAEAELDAETVRKITNNIQGNNPQYEPPELASFGLADEQREVDVWEIKARKRPANEANAFANALGKAMSDVQQVVDQFLQTRQPDEVFVDLRESKCFNGVRSQGKCGSCYAFAAIAIFEWLFCMETGRLVSFSEQYMLDCGLAFVKGVNGCAGGNEFGVIHFASNFGLEMRKSYPYMARTNVCPYEKNTSIKRTGFIRFDYQDAAEIEMSLWPKILKKGPLWVGISREDSFREYGGGVFGWGCDQERATHAVVLVGHGREDGHEYWLIRNSHSVGWGENGYGKLAKAANCVPRRVGFAFGTDDGIKTKADISVNHLNDNSKIKTHYLKHVLIGTN